MALVRNACHTLLLLSRGTSPTASPGDIRSTLITPAIQTGPTAWLAARLTRHIIGGRLGADYGDDRVSGGAG